MSLSVGSLSSCVCFIFSLLPSSLSEALNNNTLFYINNDDDDDKMCNVFLIPMYINCVPFALGLLLALECVRFDAHAAHD